MSENIFDFSIIYRVVKYRVQFLFHILDQLSGDPDIQPGVEAYIGSVVDYDYRQSQGYRKQCGTEMFLDRKSVV